MKKYCIFLSLIAFVTGCQIKPDREIFGDEQLAERVDSVLQLMTLTEKIGQLNQIKGQFSTGIDEGKEIHAEEWIREGKVGSILNHRDLEGKIRLQEIAVQESRLGIPIIFGRDVIDEAVNLAKQAYVIICAIGENGYQTGEGASRADITLPGNQEELLKAYHKQSIL